MQVLGKNGRVGGNHVTAQNLSFPNPHVLIGEEGEEQIPGYVNAESIFLFPKKRKKKKGIDSSRRGACTSTEASPQVEIKLG